MNCIQEKSLSEVKYVDNEHVDSVIRTYKKERWVQNSEHIGKEDSLSAWSSVEDLEKFIEKSKLHGADGIKMYYAAYPNDYSDKPEYSGRQTLIMVATKSKETSQGTINKDLYISEGTTPQILAIDGFKLCPPVCYYQMENQIGVTIVDRGEKGFSMI